MLQRKSPSLRSGGVALLVLSAASALLGLHSAHAKPWDGTEEYVRISSLSVGSRIVPEVDIVLEANHDATIFGLCEFKFAPSDHARVLRAGHELEVTTVQGYRSHDEHRFGAVIGLKNPVIEAVVCLDRVEEPTLRDVRETLKGFFRLELPEPKELP